MRREREGTYHTYRSGRTRRISRILHNRGHYLPAIQRHIPPLPELKRIKEAKISRIRDMVRRGAYDTAKRQIETARKIADILLAERSINN